MAGGKTQAEYVNILKTQTGASESMAGNLVKKIFGDYQRSVTFKNVYPGSYDLEIRACIFCSDELATTFNGAIMQVAVTVGTTILPATYFKVTANPTGSLANVVSFGFYEKIEVTDLTTVKATVKLMDAAQKVARDISIDDNTTIGFTLIYVDKT